MIKNIKKLYVNAFKVALVHKNLIVFLTIVNIVFFVFGQWMVYKGLPGVISFRDEAVKNLSELLFLKPITGIFAPYLILKIFYTFVFNLLVGAFLTTTAPGILFFMPYIVTVLRAWSVGVIFYGLLTDPVIALAFYGTFVLEFAAYIFSAVAGINIGLSILFPGRKDATTRIDAFRISIDEALWLYLIVASLLFIGAVWEIGWLHYGTLVPPNELTLPSGIDML